MELLKWICGMIRISNLSNLNHLALYFLHVDHISYSIVIWVIWKKNLTIRLSIVVLPNPLYPTIALVVPG